MTEMRALAVAGWAGSAPGDTRYGGKWVWLAGRGHCTEFSVGVAAGPWSLQLGATGGARRLWAFY